MKKLVDAAILKNVLYLNSDQELKVFRDMATPLLRSTFQSAGIALPFPVEDVYSDKGFQVNLICCECK